MTDRARPPARRRGPQRVASVVTLMILVIGALAGWSRSASATGSAAAGATTAAAGPEARTGAKGAAGYVTRSGSQLLVGGKPWKFAGYNLPCQQPFLMTTSQLEYYFDDVKENSGGNVVRMWWFQSDLGSGADPWAPYDTIVAAAKATGVRIIPTLTNQWNTCDEPDPANSEKTLTWYQNGYSEPEGGYSLSFETFAQEMAAHFANSPTVAFWQLVNEAEAPATSSSGQLVCYETAAAGALRSFADVMATALHRSDPHHLVNLGTEGEGECGTAGADYSYVQAGAVDLCEVHDYTNPAVALDPTIAADIGECQALDKPIFVGESGIPANVGPDGSSGSSPISLATLRQRAAFFKAKIVAGNSAGLAGYVIWFKSPFYTPALDTYAMAEGDPTEAVLPYALTPDA